jgi:glycosyltransferase involved in cell wall biosynthesis
MQKRFSISFVLPMYNESDNIETTVTVLKSLGETLCQDYEIVIVDDASTDASANIVADMANTDKRVKLYRLPKNTKFGGAFAEGFKKASKDIILYMDSDLPVSSEDVASSLPLIDEAAIVTGYSKIKKGDTPLRKIISWVYNKMVRRLFGLDIEDINSGYKIVRKDLVRDLEFISESPFIDVELFLHAKKKGATVRQYPLVFKSRTGGRSHIAGIPFILATFRDMIKVKLTSKGA